LFLSPIWHHGHAGGRVLWYIIIINVKKFIIYHAVYDADKENLALSIKKSLNTQQDITASSSVV